MTQPRPSVRRLARAIAGAELARGGGLHDADAARRIVARLRQELGKLVGPAGFDVLLARSLALARRAHPVLGGITAGPGGTLAGLDDAGRDGVALQDGAMAIVSHFIELLAVLVGEDLATRLVRDIWRTATVVEGEEQ